MRISTGTERDEAIQSMKVLIDNNVRQIMAGRAMLLKIEKLDNGDEKPLQDTIDAYIADAGVKYKALYDEMDFVDVLLERLKEGISEKQEMADEIEGMRSDLEALFADDSTDD